MKQTILTKTDTLEMTIEAKQALLSHAKGDGDEDSLHRRLSGDAAFRATMKNVLTFEYYPFLREGGRHDFWNDFDAAREKGEFSLTKDDVFQLLNAFDDDEPDPSKPLNKTYEESYGMSAGTMLSLFGNGTTTAPNTGINTPISDSKWLFTLVEAGAYQAYDDMVGAPVAENVDALVKERAEALGLTGIDLNAMADFDHGLQR